MTSTIIRLLAAALLSTALCGQAASCDLASLPTDPVRRAEWNQDYARRIAAVAELKALSRRKLHGGDFAFATKVVVTRSWKGLRVGEQLTVYTTRYSDGDCTSPAPEIGRRDVYVVSPLSPKPVLTSVWYGMGALEQYRSEWERREAAKPLAKRTADDWLELGAFFFDWSDWRNAREAYSRVVALDPSRSEATERLVEINRKIYSRP